jgi:NAD-dependent dihydropyrimidine dehydrogenase PreA subunit
MTEFIEVEIDQSTCSGIKACGECVKVCPVNVFDKGDEEPVVVKENEDECTLCNLCRQACSPNAITIHKLYEEI